ncbi:uncharacterized protein LOC129716197 isoform X1 [Leucoraja erinacea]|uniref:uncharacterized protein LOC129716197 isoform X1 n=1 Tax=Leucoraja erinaceus TaxID=7782 RepID=UPI002453BEAC|nr:uncharacterized protein LOC129716197 isoform X1 [Leucoraja erinacea]
MSGKLIQCDACSMWEVKDTAGASGCYKCEKCIQVELLKGRVGELEKQVDDLRFVRETESFLDKSYSTIVTPKVLEERRWETVRKGGKHGMPTSPGDVPLVNRFIRLEGVGTEDVSGGQACDANRAVEPKPKRPKAGKAIVVGDSIVRGTDRGFCGNRRDARMVCCLPGARIQDVTDRVQKILKGEGEHPEVVVHVGTNDVGKKGMNILQRDFRELGKMLKSRTSRVVISGLLPVPRAGESRNREIRDLNVWLRIWCTGQGFRFLDHWDLFWGKGDCTKGTDCILTGVGPAFWQAGLPLLHGWL